MYGIIRLIITFLFFSCLLAISKKNKVNKLKFRPILAGVSVILVLVLEFLPIENLIVTFKSPESAYKYLKFYNSNIDLVVEGNNCDLVVEQEYDSYSYLILPKTSDGWKIAIGLNTQNISQKFVNGILVNVYQYKRTNDYFIAVTDTTGDEVEISDDRNSEFQCLERYNDSLEKKIVVHFAHVSNFTAEYSLTVNGNKITLQNVTEDGMTPLKK